MLAQSFAASAWARRTRTEFVAVPVPGLFAAGDLIAGRPRTVLEALHAGIVTGRGAASEP